LDCKYARLALTADPRLQLRSMHQNRAGAGILLKCVRKGSSAAKADLDPRRPRKVNGSMDLCGLAHVGRDASLG
jgi:hypothetical protein